MKYYTGLFSKGNPENSYREMTIGCFAPTATEKNVFIRSFADENMKLIKSISINVNLIKLLDGTLLRFFSLESANSIRGYRFSQLMFYNMTENDLPTEILCQLDNYIPLEILKDTRYLYYKN